MPTLLDTLRCPILGVIMADPAILVCSGLSYERSALEHWIAQYGTNPETGEPLQDARLVGNPCLRLLIEDVMSAMAAQTI
jgi:hypothetical protein